MKNDMLNFENNKNIIKLSGYNFGGGITGVFEKGMLILEKTDRQGNGYMWDFELKRSPIHKIGLIEKLIVGDGVKYIGKNSFAYSNIKNLLIGNSVEVIGKSAFKNCNLKELDIPNNVLFINSSAFSYNKICDLKIGEGVLEIEAWAFVNNKIKNLKIGDSVKNIGIEAFANNRIKHLVFGENIESIGVNAFTSNKLNYIKLPDATKEIGEAAFFGNEITKIDIGNDVYIKSYIPEELLEIDTFGANVGFKEAYYKEIIKGGSYYWNKLNKKWIKDS